MKASSPALLALVVIAAMAPSRATATATVIPTATAAPTVTPTAAPISTAPLAPYAGWPTEPSAKPKVEEWRDATPLPLLRPNGSCDAARVREWLRVSCRLVSTHQGATHVREITGIRVVGGSTADVELLDRPPAPGQPLIDQFNDRIPHGIVVIFPVRPGDRRLIQLVLTVFEGRYTMGEDVAAMLSALWLPSDPGPTIVLH